MTALGRASTADPLEDLVALVGRAESGLSADTVRAVVLAAAVSRAARTRLLKQLRANPRLLTSGSAEATRPVSRLALALVDAGATAITAPRCARCGDAVLLTKRAPEGGICDACYNRARVADCSRCGQHRRIAGREPNGDPICSSCRARDPANHTVCAGCGRLAPVNTRTANGEPLCNRCSTAPPDRCDGCGELAQITSRKTGAALCRRCYRSPRRRCGRCGRLARIAVRGRDGQPDLCPNCHWAPVGRCSRCRREGPGFGRRASALVCLRCSAAEQLDTLITAPDGTRAAHLLAVRDALLAADQPRSIHTWLSRSPGRQILRRLARGELALSHAALDGLPQTSSLTHLRALLVAARALPERDPQLARLERAIPEIAATLEDPDDRRLLRAYAMWRVLHRLRRRHEEQRLGPLAADSARDRLAHVARFLAWLRERGHGLEHVSQAELDAWVASQSRGRSILGPFLRWAGERDSAPDLRLPSRSVSSCPVAVAPEARWALARWLLHDDTIDTGDRVAGALVVLYAQPVARIARLRRNDITERQHQLFLRLRHEPVLMPAPLDELLRELPARRQIGASGTVPAAAQWLFPGRHAGEPQHPEHIRRRLASLGVDCRANRNAALLQLATELPAAVLADMLGITANTAVRWIKAAGGDWTNYAARRARTNGAAASVIAGDHPSTA